MIEAITGWTCEQRASGFVLIPPAGEDAGGIRYEERLRPLRRMREIVDGLPVPADYRVTAVSAIEPLVTVEGEHGAIVVVDGELAGAPLQRTIGVVFCDDAYSLTIGVARRADHRAMIGDHVRRLVRHDTHMLGVRRRRFVHAAPEGWYGVFAGSAHVQWVPPAYPRDPRTLAVFPALPSGELDAEGVLHMIAERAGTTVMESPLLVCTPAGLSGHWWTLADGDLVHDVVVLADDRYLYPVTATSPAIARGDTLRALIDSIEPIPRATPGARHRAAIAHWID